MEERYIDILIKQLLKHSNNSNQPIIFDGNKMIINPIDINGYNETVQVTINDAIYLNYLLGQYIEAIKNSKIKFTEFNERYGIKYHLSYIWNNATNFDFANPESFIKRYTSFISDKTFNYIDNLTYICNIGKIADIESNIYVKRDECERGYETPYELNFYIGDMNNPNAFYHFPTIRYGIEKYNHKKRAYLYAIESSRQPIMNKYDMEVDNYFRKINTNISGMANRGVHTPVFLISLALFLGMLNSEGIDEILISDMLIGRRKNKKRFNQMNEEQLDKLQYNLTNKLLNSFLRLSKEFVNFDISSFPNDIDSFMHIRIGTELISDNYLLNEIYKIGNNVINNKNKQL